MALPFYNQGDQDIYAGGEHFIPQERFRLGYTAPPSIANAPNTGITNTQAAVPYIWPPQGGGGGGGGGFSNTNKYGLNLDTMKTISQGKYVEQGGPANMYGGDYVKKDRQIAQDEHGNWKDINTNQNVYHANLHNVKGIVGTVGDWLTGKSKNRDTRIGTWTGAEWDDEFDPTVANRDLNVYTRWKAKKEFRAAQEKAAADKAAADAAAATGPRWRTEGGGQDTPGAGGENVRSSSGDVYGGEAYGYNEAAEKSDYYKHGGRIGYRDGLFVDENIEGPGYDFNEGMEIASAPHPMDALNDFSLEIFNKPYDQLNDEERGILHDLANEQVMGEQDQGIASLV